MRLSAFNSNRYSHNGSPELEYNFAMKRIIISQVPEFVSTVPISKYI